MRIQPWIKAVAIAAMLSVAEAPCWGQAPFSDGATLYGSPEAMAQGFPGAPAAYYPPPFAAGGSADPSYLYPQETPDGFNPWPQISPFNPPNVSQTQTYNQGGLWYKEMLYRRRDFSFTVSGMMMQYRNVGHANIGAPYARRGNYGGLGLPEGTPADGTYAGMPLLENFGGSNIAGFYIVNNKVYPYPSLAVSTAVLTANASDHYYPIFTAGAMGSPEMAPGIQLETGYFNEDETGVRLTGWGAMDASASFSRGVQSIGGVELNRTLVDRLGGGIITTMNGNVPLDNGEPFVPDFGTGSTAKYDLYYGLRMKTSAAGANISIYQQPLYKNDGVMIRPLWGARYLNISESFGFTGIDSGYNYTLSGVSTTGTGGGGGGTGTGTGSGSGTGTASNGGIHAQTSTMVPLYDQYTATLNNRVQSNLAGPEAGLRFDFGNPRKGFTVWGESIFGVTVNNQQIDMNGNQIGDALSDVRIRGYLTPRILANDSRFSHSQNSTHISPTFQQSVYADFDFIDVIPVLREIPLLDNSSFRIGYSVLWVGALSRPADTIKWQGYPLFPQINKNYNSWWAQQVTASLNFDF